MWRRTASIISPTSSLFSQTTPSLPSPPPSLSLTSLASSSSSRSLPLTTPTTPTTTTPKRFLNLPQNFVPYPSSSRPPTFKKLPEGLLEQQKARQAEAKKELSNDISLSTLFPGAPDPKDTAHFETPPPQFSTLENGVTVVSQEIAGGTFSVEVMFKVGVVNEPKKGMVSVLQHLAFQSCAADPSTVKFLSEAGANIFATGLPEVFSFSGEGLRHHLPQVMKYLHQAITNPSFHEEEVEYFKEIVMSDAEMTLQDPASWINQALQQAAFPGSTLSNRFQLTHRPDFTASELLEFFQDNFHAGNMVISAAGVNHEEFVDLAQQMFGGMEKKEPLPTAPQKYVGGSLLKVPLEGPTTAVAIGFEGPSLFGDIHTLCVLSSLMGGGHSFSAGGPGKGMYSRLVLDVLNRYHFVKTCLCEAEIYRESGVFSLFSVSETPNSAFVMLELLVLELEAILKNVNEIEVTRAKNRLAGMYLTNLNSRAAVVNDINLQVLLNGEYQPTEYHLKNISSVSVESIQELVVKLLKSPPTVVVCGSEEELKVVPEIDRVADFFKRILEAKEKQE